jgi:hypothetical protein
MNNAAMLLVRNSLEMLRREIAGRPEVLVTANPVGLVFEFTWDTKPAVRASKAYSAEHLATAQAPVFPDLVAYANAMHSNIERGKHDTRSNLERGFGRVPANKRQRRRGGKGEVLGCE